LGHDARHPVRHRGRWYCWDTHDRRQHGSSHRRRRRRPARIVLPAWLAAELRAWLADGGELWQRLPYKNPGKLLQIDLVAVGIPYRIDSPDGPLYLDMHSLRHFYCTEVGSQPGMDLRTLLTLTRHSTPDLALKRYGHQQEDKLLDAISRLPDLTKPAANGDQKKDKKGG
jgi:hypothetical protein